MPPRTIPVRTRRKKIKVQPSRTLRPLHRYNVCGGLTLGGGWGINTTGTITSSGTPYKTLFFLGAFESSLSPPFPTYPTTSDKYRPCLLQTSLRYSCVLCEKYGCVCARGDVAMQYYQSILQPLSWLYTTPHAPLQPPVAVGKTAKSPPPLRSTGLS